MLPTAPTPSSSPSPHAHLLHHPPPLGHHVEKALDHLELLHGQWLGLHRGSPDRQGQQHNQHSRRPPSAPSHSPGLHWTTRSSFPSKSGRGNNRSLPCWGNRGQKGQVTFSRSPREVCGNQERSCRCPISSCSSGFLMCPQHPGAAHPLLPPSPQPSGALAPMPLTPAARQSHHGETGGVFPEPCPGWPCPRPSGS